MAIAISKTPLHFRPPLSLCSLQARRSFPASSVETLDDVRRSDQELPRPTQGKKRKCSTTSLKELGISISIPKEAKSVLNGLRKKGYEVYLVGGCVRDTLMMRTPKDFDIITTADLRQVKQTFSRCEIIGRRFPICHVHIKDAMVEVSSFSTSGRRSSCNHAKVPPDIDEHDYHRWRNCFARDFTINGSYVDPYFDPTVEVFVLIFMLVKRRGGPTTFNALLMLNPFSGLVYDYFGGIKDLKKAKVQTVIPPETSFQEDCARILRGIRIASRLGFSFSRETARSIVDRASSVLKLDKGRLLMEINYMFAYGSAEASLRMLWRFGLLELLLPFQAAYFVSEGFRRRDKRTNMLLALFSNLDSHLAPDMPCHNSLWVGLLAFHEALVRKPQDPQVVATFIFALNNGGDLAETVKIARVKTHHPSVSFSELLQPQEWRTDGELINEVLDLASLVDSALNSMTNEYFVSQAMARYPQAPYSDLVFIPLQVYLSVRKMFECVGSSTKDRFHDQRRRRRKISYSSSSLPDVRAAFAQVVLDTIYPSTLSNNMSSKDLEEESLTT